MDTADIIIESRTQDAATIQRVLEASGHTDFEAETFSDQPAPETPAVDPAAVPAVAEPAVEDPNAPIVPKPPRGYKHKFEQQREENARLREQLAARSPAADTNIPSDATPPAAAAAPVTPAAAAAAASEPDPEPNPEDFENGVYDPLFLKAINKWSYKEERRQEREQADTAAAEVVEQGRKDAEEQNAGAFKTWWEDQIADAKDAHTDFDAVIAKDHGYPILNPLMVEAMQSMDTGGELAYWLGTHPEESARIHKITELKTGETAVHFRKKLALALKELDKIQLDLPVIEDQDEDEVLEPAATVAAPVPAARRAAAPSPAAPRTPAPAPPKPAPPNPVGSRGGAPRKRLSQMGTEELRALSTDQFRRLRKEEYGT